MTIWTSYASKFKTTVLTTHTPNPDMRPFSFRQSPCFTIGVHPYVALVSSVVMQFYLASQNQS
ncbi:hypothetical protein ARMSODRAFT_105648 [Armillaria solidipes]|uniref:Uncharacterized protein n=1 Tax=Armillaria solidipes TaxID=1076256 RepID=A0A2H3ALJ1_9AGAR|nr:hypothetical protein ARMSODRAFT_105648 [Armillaria solidipes]